VPRLLVHGIKELRPSLVLLAMDLAVPPLSLLALMIFVVLGIATGVGLAGLSWIPLMVGMAAAVVLLASVLTGWLQFGREVVSLGTLVSAPIYVLRKMWIYVTFMIMREKRWIRTERNGEGL